MKTNAAAQTKANRTNESQVVISNRYTGTRVESLASFQMTSSYDVVKQIVHPVAK